MRSKKRKKEAKLRRIFFPNLIVSLVLWAAIGLIVYFVDPSTFAIIPIFFPLLFFALLLTFALIFANSRRGLVAATSLILFLILSYFGIGNILNFLLILGLAITIEIYFLKNTP